MKTTFSTPRVTLQGSLRAVTAAASGPIGSDEVLKHDIEPYEQVLPRLKELSQTAAAEGHTERRQFQIPVFRHEGSLRSVTAAASFPGFSDVSLKTEVASYDPVLPRLKKLS